MTKVKKKVEIVLEFQRRGSGDPITHRYTDVARTQTHWDNAGHRIITIHRDTQVHQHSETDDYRLVRMSKYFS